MFLHLAFALSYSESCAILHPTLLRHLIASSVIALSHLALFYVVQSCLVLFYRPSILYVAPVCVSLCIISIVSIYVYVYMLQPGKMSVPHSVLFWIIHQILFPSQISIKILPQFSFISKKHKNFPRTPLKYCTTETRAFSQHPFGIGSKFSQQTNCRY